MIGTILPGPTRGERTAGRAPSRLPVRILALAFAPALALCAGCAAGPEPAVPPAATAPVETPAQAWERISPSFPANLPGMPADGTPLNKGLVAGSWPPDPELGFDKPWLDEAATVQVWTNERVARRPWRGMTSGGETVPVDALLRDREGPAIGYVFSLLARRPPGGGLAPDAAAVLHVRHRGRLKLWFDGRLVLDAQPAPGVAPALEHVPVVLTGPYDIVLLKLGRGSEELGPSMDVEVRVSDLAGRALGEMIWTTMRTPGLPSDLPSTDAAEPTAEPPGSDG